MRAKTIDDVGEMLWVLQDEIRRSEEARYDHRLHGVLLVSTRNERAEGCAISRGWHAHG